MNNEAFGQITDEQRVQKFKDFREAGLELKANQDPPNGDNGKVSVLAANCQVKSVPFPVLEMIFDRANNLLAKNDTVIPKLGATDG